MNQLTINSAIRADMAKFARDENINLAWPNMAFEDINQPYLQLHIMPAAMENLGLALDMPVFTGVIQINVIGKVGTGDSVLMNIADRLAKYLFNGKLLTDSLYINGECSIYPPIIDHANYTLPVSTRYRCHTIR